MSGITVEFQPHGYILLPDPDTGPLGLLLGVSTLPDRPPEKLTILVDGVWLLRAGLVGPDGILSVPDVNLERVLSVYLPGWPEDWTDEDLGSEMTVLFLEGLSHCPDAFPAFAREAERVVASTVNIINSRRARLN